MLSLPHAVPVWNAVGDAVSESSTQPMPQTSSSEATHAAHPQFDAPSSPPPPLEVPDATPVDSDARFEPPPFGDAPTAPLGAEAPQPAPRGADVRFETPLVDDAPSEPRDPDARLEPPPPDDDTPSPPVEAADLHVEPPAAPNDATDPAARIEPPSPPSDATAASAPATDPSAAANVPDEGSAPALASGDGDTDPASQDEEATLLAIGDVVGDRYRLLDVLGRGGMGTVYLAEHTAIAKQVAIKVLAAKFANHAGYRHRFSKEAQAVTQVAHENVVEVVDFGETREGCLYIVMELLRGRGLAQILREEGPVPWPRAQPILIQISRALQAAHQKGILHRDVKPENCFLVRRGQQELVKVLDFGLATGLDEREHEPVDDPGPRLGTAEYMSPEQIMGDPLDARSDVYSMGILMYEVLSGYVPFSGDHYSVIWDQHLEARAISLQKLVPEANIPAEVEAIIYKALSKRAEERFASAADLARALASIAQPRRSSPIERALATRERFYLSVIVVLSALVVALMLVLAYVAASIAS